MFYDYHFTGMHGIWWVVMLIIGMLVIYFIPYRPKTELEENALDILKKRFARGEIEREEFEERKKILKQSN